MPLRRCNETVRLVNGAPLAVSCPVIEKDCLTCAEEGAEMVRAVGDMGGTDGGGGGFCLNYSVSVTE